MNSNLKLLFADDEQIMRDGLPKIIEWERYGIEVLPSVSNGQKALEVCKKERVDIVVTDIRMPVMDGLELTELLKDYDCSMKIVILSAYDDFKYAQTALKVGADAYLLKSEIDSDNLLGLILNLSEEILRSRTMENSYKKMQNIVSSHVRELRNNLCLSLLSGVKCPLDINSQMDTLSINLRYRDLCIIHIFFKKETSHDQLERTLSSAEFLENCYIVDPRKKYLIVLCNLKSPAVTDVAKRVHGLLQQNFCGECGVVTTPVFKGYDNLSSYQQILGSHTIQHIFYEKYSCALTVYKKHQPPTFDSGEIMSQFVQASQMNLINRMEQIVFSFIQQLLIEEYSIRDLKETLVFFADIAQKKLHDTSDTLLSQDIISKPDFEECTTLNSMAEAATEYFQVVLSQLHESIYPDNTIVKKAIEYIEQHIGETVTLKVIADNIYCNPTYLSQVFKKETGKNFSDFLIQARVNRALNLLEHTNLFIKDIAQQVGIPNQSYFSRSIIKATGMQPSRYRSVKQHVLNI